MLTSASRTAITVFTALLVGGMHIHTPAASDLPSRRAAIEQSAGTLLVLNKEDATLAIVDPAARRVLARVQTGEAPHEVAVAGTTAVISNYGAQTPGQSLSIVDLAARRETQRLDLGPLRRPHGLSVSGGKVYFTAELNRLIARYDPATQRVDWMLGTGQPTTHMVWVRSDGAAIYTANIGGDSISIVQRGANDLAWDETVVPVGKGPEGFDVSPDGRQLWAAHSRDGGVSILDLQTKKVVGTIDLQTKRSNRLKFTPDGTHVLVSDLDAGEVVVIDVPSRKAINRIKMGKSPEGILIEPGGARAYVAVNGDNHVAIVDLKTFAVVGTIETGAGPDGMAWAER